MPLVAAAVCPHPPMIVPELAGAAAEELDDLRLACAEAVARLLAAEPDTVLVLGTGPRTVRHGPADYGDLRGYGLDRRVRLGRAEDGTGRPGLPLSLLVGAWLLHRAGAGTARRGQSVAADASPADCRRLGGELVQSPDDRVALLVMGDGTACRGERSPGYDDPRARPYDDRVAAALGTADRTTLLALEPELSARLRVAGRAPWQVLCGAADVTGAAWRAELLHYAAPYGVSYFVASWLPGAVAASDGLPGAVAASDGLPGAVAASDGLPGAVATSDGPPGAVAANGVSGRVNGVSG